MRQIIPRYLLAGLAFAVFAGAAEERPGPNGGRLLPADQPAEFWVDPEGRAVITFLDDELQPVPVGDQTVRIVAMAPAGRQSQTMERKDGVLVSSEPLPEGDGYTVVVQIATDPEARPRNFRIVYEDHVCGGCDLVEYACICGH